MAKIISFRRRRPATSAIPAAPVAVEDFAISSSNWTNQELADLYRVKVLMEKAGVYLDADRGVTDEGDPWFVLCGLDGEVFVHLARLGQEYLLDSPNLDSPLRGFTFQDLINGFVRRASTAGALAQANVVPLRPGSRVHLPPAIMLTALVWSIFILAEDLVGFAHAATDEFDSADYGSSGSADDRQGAESGELVAAGKTHGASSSRATPQSETERDTANVNHYASGIAASISMIAIACGMLAQSSDESGSGSMSEAVRMLREPSASPHEDQVKIAVLPASGEIISNGDASADGEPGGLVFEATETTIAAAVVVLPASVPLANEAYLHAVPTDGASVETRMAHSEPGLDGVDDLPPVIELEAPSSSATAHVEKGSELLLNQAFVDLLALGVEAMTGVSSYVVADVVVVASIDIAEVVGLSIDESYGSIYSTVGDLILHEIEPAARSPQESEANDSMYSELVTRFVDYLLAKQGDVQLIALPNEIILLDMSAFDSLSDVSYARSWHFEGGGMISTIGHLNDFHDFGLV